MHCIITGAARGIGRAIARRLAQDSLTRDKAPAALLLSDQHASELEVLAEELRALGHHVTCFAGDMSDPAVPQRMVDAAVAAFKTVDVVISNAGYAVGNSLMDFKIEDWDRNFAVHTRGAWLLAKAAYPHLKASQGNMVVTASISGSNATPALGAYSPSKAATLMFAKQLAVEWGPDGIRVNALSPGLVHTDGSNVVFADPEVKALRASKIPLRRVADPDDMAKVVSFIVGPDAAYLSGADIVVDGGLVNTLMPNLGMSNNWTGKVTG